MKAINTYKQWDEEKRIVTWPGIAVSYKKQTHPRSSFHYVDLIHFLLVQVLYSTRFFLLG